MKERPILFSAPMVRAILAGQKTQTRRAMKLSPSAIGCCCGGSAARWVAEGDRWHCGVCGGGARLTARDVEYVRCPYGQPGDRLWVRETFRGPLDDGSHGYRATHAGPFTWESYTWKPSIHMPRAASRITLDITGVRVERLQSINDADACDEGAEPRQPFMASGIVIPGQYRLGFCDLWISINGRSSWDDNPWVWVVEFKRVEAAHG